MLSTNLNRVGIDEDKKTKNLFELLAEECFEIMSADASGGDAYPYDFKSAFEWLEYRHRDGFIPNVYNKGGFSLTVYGDINHIVGSGYYPSSVEAHNRITAYYEYGRQCALNDLGLVNKTELTDEEQEKVYEKTDEYNSEDTIMYQINVMYHGMEKGIHKATIQVVINWESPYHRSSLAGTGFSGKTEDYLETEITWKTNRSFRIQVLKAVKNGVKKLF